MSFDLMTLLNRQGYLTSRKVGYYYTDADNKTCSPFNQAHWNCKHTWLEVWVYDNETCNNKLIRVEATSGKIIPDKVYQAHYR